ncbi:Candidapepsin-3 [Cladochytrium tenue]|nr:Candidapepsin-3 [Cladochytrium tenue]
MSAISLHVGTITGTRISLDRVRPTDTVGDLKRRIEMAASIPSHQQQLVFREQTLADDSANVAQLGLRDGSSLRLTVSMRSGRFWGVTSRQMPPVRPPRPPSPRVEDALVLLLCRPDGLYLVELPRPTSAAATATANQQQQRAIRALPPLPPRRVVRLWNGISELRSGPAARRPLALPPLSAALPTSKRPVPPHVRNTLIDRRLSVRASPLPDCDSAGATAGHSTSLSESPVASAASSRPGSVDSAASSSSTSFLSLLAAGLEGDLIPLSSLQAGLGLFDATDLLGLGGATSALDNDDRSGSGIYRYGVSLGDQRGADEDGGGDDDKEDEDEDDDYDDNDDDIDDNDDDDDTGGTRQTPPGDLSAALDDLDEDLDDILAAMRSWRLAAAATAASSSTSRRRRHHRHSQLQPLPPAADGPTLQRHTHPPLPLTPSRRASRPSTAIALMRVTPQSAAAAAARRIALPVGSPGASRPATAAVHAAIRSRPSRPTSLPAAAAIVAAAAEAAGPADATFATETEAAEVGPSALDSPTQGIPVQTTPPASSPSRPPPAMTPQQPVAPARPQVRPRSVRFAPQPRAVAAAVPRPPSTRPVSRATAVAIAADTTATTSDAPPPAAGAAGRRPRCATCGSRLGAAAATAFRCRGCARSFCATHRYSDRHACPFDYRAAARATLERDNPRVGARKIDQL